MKNGKTLLRWAARGLGALLVAGMAFMVIQAVPAAFGAGTITLDGQFDDWSGQSCISDPQYDALGPYTDLKQLCFATNANVTNAYFMVERFDSSGGKPLDLVLYFDTNNNGSYSDPTDKQANITYNPNGNSSTVSVSVGSWGASGDWGQSISETAVKEEFYIPFSALGISAGTPIRMYMVSYQGNTLSDGTAEVQWSPANALGLVILVLILATASIYFAFRQRKLTQAG